MAQAQDLNPRERYSADSDTITKSDARDDEAAVQKSAPAPARRGSESVCVHYGGRQFITTYEMAGIFLRRSQRLIDTEDAELVPLVHEGGLELLYVSCATPFSVHDADTESADGAHAGFAETGGSARETL